jgi:hypothetical protein
MVGEEPAPRTKPAYAACVCAGLFAAVSLYWALGGTAGLRTLGGSLEQIARSRRTEAIVVIWVTVLLKVAGALLPLSLVRPWGSKIPRRLRVIVAGGTSLVLVLYGGVNVGAEALVELGLITPAGRVDWFALGWHLALWDSWFLLWGILLGTATWRFLRDPAPG